MNNITEDIVKIKYNAFTLAPVLLAFYACCHVERDNILLYKLIIPILSSKHARNGALFVRRTSSLSSWIIDDKLDLAGIEERVDCLKTCSLTALQYCFDQGWATVDDKNNVVVSLNSELKKVITENYMCKNAQSLNKLFDNLSVADILLQFGLHIL